jgi:hypothetical protein
VISPITCCIITQNYFLRNVLYQESRLNADYVPTAIKKIGLTLQSLEEVKDSKDYKAVFDRYIADKEATKIRWTEYVNEVDNLTRLGLKQRFLTSFCKFLNSTAKGFKAEVGTHPSYTEHEAVTDHTGNRTCTSARQTILPYSVD